MDTNGESTPAATTSEKTAKVFRAALEREAARLGEFAGAALGSRTDADALVVETFEAAFREAAAGDDGAFSTVRLFATLRRKCAQRAERKRGSSDGPEVVGRLGSRARALLSALRPSERDAVLLRYVADLAVSDVARACGVDEETALRRVSNGVVALCRAARPGSVATDADNAKRAAVVDLLAEVLAGTAPPDLVDFVADDDLSRDLVHDAEHVVELVRAVDADHTVDLDAVERDVLARVAPAPLPVAPPDPPNPPSDSRADDSSGTAAPAAPAPPATPPPSPKPSPPEPVPTGFSRLMRSRFPVPVAALAIVAVGALIFRHSSDAGDAGDAWRGRVVDVSPAGGDANGLERCSPDRAVCMPVGSDGEIPAGSVLRTDGTTRAVISLTDGNRIVVDRATELALDGNFPGRARLEHGAAILDASGSSSRTVRVDVPLGHVETSSGKVSVTVDPGHTAVEVVRGSAMLSDLDGHDVTVRAGEEGRLERGTAPVVSSTAYFGGSFGWTERAFVKTDSPDIVGLGELRAKKPGEDHEREHAVELASHSTKVRISGNVARTEIEEVFANGSDDVLEGIYRFPLPPDAEIERLALDVDGKLEDGAFVDRDRAAAIWRGAIVNAGAKKPAGEEIVWVPGPWRDPALLEWQRGGRFELHVYPIPKHGTRRVLLSYTQVIPPSGSVRTYTYPLAHDASGKLVIGTFDVDVEVRGHEPKSGVAARGYDFHEEALPGGVESFHYRAERFVPRGDISVEYALPNPDQEVTTWAYQPSPDEALAERGSSAAAPNGANQTSGGDFTGDAYVVAALRPKLPRIADGARRSFAVVVDSSRSMFGERYRRASELAARIVGEMDRDDALAVLACDSTCRELPPGSLSSSADRASVVSDFLTSVVPEGGSDVTGAVKAARAAVRTASAGAARIVYIGDGTPTIGAVTPAFVRREIEAAVPSDFGTVTTVAIGGDADVGTLNAIASAGGGVLVPFSPGEPAGDAAYAVLGVTYGNVLRDVQVDLPDGWEDVSPQKLGAIPAGGEIMVTGRLTRPSVDGTLVLRGRIGSSAFERRYPIRVEPTTSKGNAFVPRLYAAAKIAELEQLPDAESRRRAIEMSGRFHVASRYTSLLVLESAAMFKAFGVENDHTVASFTGEDDAKSATADADLDAPNPLEEGSEQGKKGAGPALGALGGAGLGGGDIDRSAAFHAAASGASVASNAAPSAEPEKKRAETASGDGYDRARRSEETEAPAGRAYAAPPPPASPAPSYASPLPKTAARASDAFEPAPPSDVARGPLEVMPDLPPPRWTRRWIPMRKIWDRVGNIVVPPAAPSTASQDELSKAESAASTSDPTRDAIKKLYTLYFLRGDVDRASAVAERWSQKDPLDPDALTARADVAAARGERDLAIRILGSVVDVRPGDHKAQWRLARLRRWQDNPELGCRHSMAVAQIRSTDEKLLAEAVRCARDVGEASVASDLMAAASDTTRRAASALLEKPPSDPNDLSGDLRLEATWDGGDDLDLAMVHTEGRISWLGAPTRAVISARDVQSTSREGLALRGGSPGDYVVEITRPAGHSGIIHGTVDITAAGDHRTVPFSIDGDRARVALIRVTTRPRLVPL